MAADLAVLGFTALGFFFGFARGAVRQLLTLGLWLVAFVVAAHTRPVLGEWLSRQWSQFSRPYVEMLSFGIVFLVLLAVGVALVNFTGSRTTISRREWIDDVVGGFLGVVAVALLVATVFVILATVYVDGSRAPEQDVVALRHLYRALDESVIVGQLRATILPLLATILGAVLPSDIPPVMR